jgi:hypothetical protein
MVFRYQKELVERELIITKGTITGAQKSIIKETLHCRQDHHAYSTHGEPLFNLMTKPLQLSFNWSKLTKDFTVTLTYIKAMAPLKFSKIIDILAFPHMEKTTTLKKKPLI